MGGGDSSELEANSIRCSESNSRPVVFGLFVPKYPPIDFSDGQITPDETLLAAAFLFHCLSRTRNQFCFVPVDHEALMRYGTQNEKAVVTRWSI